MYNSPGMLQFGGQGGGARGGTTSQPPDSTGEVGLPPYAGLTTRPIAMPYRIHLIRLAALGTFSSRRRL